MARHNASELVAGAVVLLVAGGFLVYGVIATGRTTSSGVSMHAEFDNIGSLSSGGDVRIAGVKIGSVTRTSYDPQTYRARVDFSVAPSVKLPTDSSAQIASAGLLGGASLNLVPGGSADMIQEGQAVQITQSAANLEDLLGKFIFNVGSLADASQKQLQRDGADRQAGHASAPGAAIK